MPTFRIVKDDGEEVVVSVKSEGEGFDQADELGARRLRNGYGEKFVKIDGEWYGCGSIGQSKPTAGNGEKRQS